VKNKELIRRRITRDLLLMSERLGHAIIAISKGIWHEIVVNEDFNFTGRPRQIPRPGTNRTQKGRSGLKKTGDLEISADGGKKRMSRLRPESHICNAGCAICAHRVLGVVENNIPGSQVNPEETTITYDIIMKDTRKKR
jgi:hypothetical protein